MVISILVGLAVAARLDRLERENEEIRRAAIHYRRVAIDASEQLGICKGLVDNLSK